MNQRRFMRKAAIVEFVVSGEWVGRSRAEIARHLQMANSPHFHSLLKEMVEEKLVVEVFDERPHPKEWRYFGVGYNPGVERLTFDDDSAPSSLSLVNNEQQYNYLYALAGYDVAVGVAS